MLEDWSAKALEYTLKTHVSFLPENYSELVSQILFRFPNKPERHQLSIYLEHSLVILEWFSCEKSPSPYCRHFAFGAFKRFNNGHLIRIRNYIELSKWFGITPNELKWIADIYRQKNKKESNNHYWYTSIEKKSGGFRLIENPKGLLRQVQHKILEDITQYFPVHQNAYGFVKGKSCVHHAANHTNCQYLIKLDISNCFQSIDKNKVFKQFLYYGFNHEVSSYLANLTTHKCHTRNIWFDQFEKEQKILFKNRHLPQGASTSPSISNSVLYKLDKRLSLLSESIGYNYSRYADDLAFSGNSRLNFRNTIALISAICYEEGLEINHRKTSVTTRNKRQALTGLIVNEKVNVSRKYYDELKAILHNCIQYGLESQNREGHENYKEHLIGRINHVSMINIVKGKKLMKLLDRALSETD